jgi:multimeric flavodoxin WrbA
MKVLTIFASPRSNGNTDRVLGWIEGDLREGGHSVERIPLTTQDVRDCAACLACAESNDEPGCVLQDDVRNILEKMRTADAVLFASPLYMWGVTGTLKRLYDRFLCLVRGWGTAEHSSFIEGKRLAQLITCAGGDGENTAPASTSFDRLAGFLKADSLGTYVFPDCTEPSKLPNLHGRKARELAERLTESL